MGTHLSLLIREGPDANPSRRLTAVVEALASTGMVDNRSWTVAVPEARRSKRASESGRELDTGELLAFLASRDERGLEFTVQTPMARCFIRTRDSAPRGTLPLGADIEVDLHKVGRRYFEAPESTDERLIQRRASEHAAGVSSERAERVERFLDFISGLATRLRPRVIRVCLDSRDYAPPLATMAWYRDEASLLEDAALTAHWLDARRAAGLSAGTDLSEEVPEAGSLVADVGAAAGLRALDLPTVRRVLAESPGVLLAASGFLLVNPQMDVVRGSLVAQFDRFAREGTRG